MRRDVPDVPDAEAGLHWNSSFGSGFGGDVQFQHGLQRPKVLMPSPSRVLLGRNDAALWIVWSVERTTGAAGVDLRAVAAIQAHGTKTESQTPGARFLAVSRKPNLIRERRRSPYAHVFGRPIGPARENAR